MRAPAELARSGRRSVEPRANRALDNALTALRAGGAVLVVDDENRENEGDLVVAAERVSTETVAFLLRHTSGVLCVALPQQRCAELDLPPMAARNDAPLGTAFTVAVDARYGVTTGISAADRAVTIRALADPATTPADLTRPGHVYPLRAHPGGVAARPGHTEASLVLVELAGLRPAAVLCEVTTADKRGMARGPALARFARRHRLPVVRIADLAIAVATPAASSSPVLRVGQALIPTAYGEFDALVYRSYRSGVDHLVLTRGLSNPAAPGAGPTLVRLHSECLTGDVFSSRRCDCGEQLDTALRLIGAAPRGAVIYLRGHEGRGIGLAAKIAAYALQDAGLDTVDANLALGHPVDARDYADAGDILRDLGLDRVRLLSNNPAKALGLANAGVRVHRVPLVVPVNPQNAHYLRTKADRMGHLLPAG